jgi:hypothetical protein
MAGVGFSKVAGPCWKPRFRRLSNELISELAISESLTGKASEAANRRLGAAKGT